MPFEANTSICPHRPPEGPAGDGPGARPRRRRRDHAAQVLQAARRAILIDKVVRSAVANAGEQEAARPSATLYVAEAWVDGGPGDQAVPAEGPRQGVFDQEADQPPLRDGRRARRRRRAQVPARASAAVSRARHANHAKANRNRDLNMGQKVNPTGFRTGITEDWKSRWYAPKAAYGDFLVEDHEIRKRDRRKAQPPARRSPPSVKS